MYKERQEVSVPLHFTFNHCPKMSYASIHELTKGRNNRIKQFYWKLWFGDNSNLLDLNTREIFQGPEITIKSSNVKRFCTVVGNQSEAYRGARAIKM